MRSRTPRTAAALAFAILAVLAPTASAAVSVSRAEVSSTTLRVEGTATAGRDVTVDGAVMTRSGSDGRFRVERTGYTRPADCTIDVNDGSATPRTATLSGCTVTAPPPPLTTGPAAPAQLAPASGATVASPVTLSWSAVSDPSGIAGYNWEIGTTSTFATKVAQDSTLGTVTQDTVGGLAPGTYFWRVQGVSNAFVQGAWSAARSFTISGTAPGALGAPTLGVLPEGGQYHPMESFSFSWSAVPGAASYVVEASRDASFPAPVAIRDTNIPGTTHGLTFNDTLTGTFNLRVRAVDAAGVLGPPSNVRTFSVSYSAPVGPAPVPVSPAAGATLPLPIRLDWADVTNPQPSGYEIEVARDSGFTNIEWHAPQLTSSEYTLISLTAGTKFWRVRHHEGDASPTTAAVTPWSAPRSFTVSASGAISSVRFTRPAAFSGEEIVGTVQLASAAPAGGATVQLSSSDPAATNLPASVSVPGGQAVADFRIRTGQVTTAADATVTATYGAERATTTLRVDPPSLKEILPINQNGTITGGTSASPMLALNGAAPSGGAVVSLSSSSPVARPPATVTVPAGSFFHSLSIPTDAVQTQTTVTITATWQGRSVSYQLTLLPEVQPASFTLERTSTTGSEGTSGVVTIAAAQTRDTTFRVTSSHPDVARSSDVTVPAGVTTGRVLVQTVNPSAPTTVTLSVSAGGVTRSTTLTVNPIATEPAPSPALTAPSLLSPATGSRFSPGQSVTFDWSDVSGAAGYQLQVGSTSTFGTLVLSRTATTSRTSASFSAEGDRFWRVRATGSGGAAGPWSAVRSFRVRR